MVFPDSDKISRVPSYSGYPPDYCNFKYGTFTLYGHTSQYVPLSQLLFMQVLQPRQVNLPVWPVLRSLAATSKISFDFSSCRYLDVSVPCVSSGATTLLIAPWPPFPVARFPHSEIFGSKHAWLLPETYRWLANVLHRLLLPRYPPYTLNSFR